MRCALCSLATVLCLIGSQSIAQHPALEAWKRRASNTRTLQLKWRQASEHYKRHSKPIKFEGEFASSRSGKHRSWRFGVVNFGQLSAHEDFFVQRSLTTVNKRGERTTFFPKTNQEYPFASIATKGQSSINDLRLLPIALTYFPFEVQSWSIADGFTNSRSAQFDGHACLVFKLGEFEAWVKKGDKEFLPFRLTKHWSDGGLRYDFRIASGLSSDGTVRLDHWTFRQMGIGGLVEIENSRAELEVCMVNSPIDSLQFSQVPFPTGTRINKDGQADISTANTAVK